MSDRSNPPQTSEHPLEPLPLDQHPWVKSFSEFRGYHRTLFQYALAETLGFFGWNKQTLLVPALFFVGAIVAYSTLEGEVVRDEILTTLVFGLVPVLGLAVLVALVNIVRAPWLLDSQRRTARELEFNMAQAQVQGQSGLIEHYRSELDAANASKQEMVWRTLELEKQLAEAQSQNSELRKRLSGVAERLLPKFRILFENASPFVEETMWPDNSERRRTHYRIRVVNDSAKTIESVVVTVESFTSNGQLFKDLPLRLMNDDSRPPRKSFTLNPDDGRFIELASKDSYVDEWVLFNAYEGHRHTKTEEKDVTIRVITTGLNAISAKRRFRLHVDSSGILHCEPLDPIEVVSLPSLPLN